MIQNIMSIDVRSWFCMLRNHEFFCEVDPAFDGLKVPYTPK